MRILVISDIHANLEALITVLNEAKNFQTVYCLGDIVGYGPDPNDCIEIIKSIPNLYCVLGNHDSAILGAMDARKFNQEAKTTIEWQKSHISIENLTYLQNLPKKLQLANVLLVHGSPRHPIWEYVIDPFIARANFDHFEGNYCMVGHSHQPLACQWDPIQEKMKWTNQFNGYPKNVIPRMILNPGSVGQPRDNDPRASFAIFDDELLQWEIKRVAYPIKKTQKKIKDLGLPEKNALRLAGGW